MKSIWPSRQIKLRRQSGSEGDPLLPTELIDQIREALQQARVLVLDESTLLEEEPARQSLGLFCLGKDGVGGNGSLLLSVVYTRQYNEGPLLHLDVLSYGLASPSDMKRILPSVASEMLNTLVDRIKEVLGSRVARPVSEFDE